jgi:hypothetical protein
MKTHLMKAEKYLITGSEMDLGVNAIPCKSSGDGA